MIHYIHGASDVSLLRSLACLGLVRAIGEQADPTARFAIDSSGLTIDTQIGDVAIWLTDSFVPRPILSPWNNGAGFGTDKGTARTKLVELIKNDDARFDGFRVAFSIAEDIVEKAAEQPDIERKRWIIGEVRNRCPEAMLPWVNSAVVLLGDSTPVYPPLLGTGGNDGRFDFSTNYHQRLLDVITQRTEQRRVSLTLATDFLEQTGVGKLTKAAVGQFDPGAAGTPNSSAFGSAEGLVNPWEFILMLEGATLFGAAAARRNSAQASTDPKAAMTFMTRGSEIGDDTGSADEESRGEVWVPRWRGAQTFTTILRVFNDGRAVWRGSTATTSSAMYLAVGTGGVSPAVRNFDRYSIVQRNGLSFSALKVDEIEVTNNALLHIVSHVENWPDRLAGRSEVPGSVREQIRRFQRARVALVKAHNNTERQGRLRSLLASLTMLELAVSRSKGLRESISPRQPAPASTLFDTLRESGVLEGALSDPAFRLAVGFASLRDRMVPESTTDRRVRSLRQLLLPISPAPSGRDTWDETQVISGFGVRPLSAILVDVLRWLSISTVKSTGARDGEHIVGVRQLLGVTVPLVDLHAYVDGQIADSSLEQWTVALMAFSWSKAQSIDVLAPRVRTVNPQLALLGAVRNGLRADDFRSRTGLADNTDRHGLTAEIISLITAVGHADQAVTAAQIRLRQQGIAAVTPLPISAPTQLRLAAALLPNANHRKISVVDGVAYPIKPYDDTSEPQSTTTAKESDDD